MKKRPLIIPALAALLSTVSAGEHTTFTLANELLKEQSYELSAIEFRRFAMESESEADQASAYLYSSYAYLLNNQPDASVEMIDRSETADTSSNLAKERTLLNAEAARQKHDTDSALYFYDALATGNDDTTVQTFVRRRAAALYLATGDPTAARAQLEASPSDETVSLQALDTYAAGKDKSPAVGGLWGLIPGAGYWYSGEIANGFRSLILNSLFIYGMVDTAQNDQWGAFAIISFFEITWYSGSIYGGVDAAHRYNRDRMDTAIHAIESDMAYRPDPSVVLPLFKFNIQF